MSKHVCSRIYFLNKQQYINLHTVRASAVVQIARDSHCAQVPGLLIMFNMFWLLLKSEHRILLLVFVRFSL